MRNDSLDKFCRRMGGQVAAARLVGVNPRTMRRWVAGESTPRGLARKALEKHMGKIVVDG